MSPSGFRVPTPRLVTAAGKVVPRDQGPPPAGFEFSIRVGPPRGPPLCNPLDLSPPLVGYLLSLFAVSLFLLMIGSSAFSNWWLGLWLDKGSQVSFPLALEKVESVVDGEHECAQHHTMNLPRPLSMKLRLVACTNSL